MNAAIDTMLSHRSIRAFDDRPVEGERLEKIVEAVQAAPNWVNLQHVSIVAIMDGQRREKLAKLCGNQKHIAQAPVFLVFCADFYRTWLACGESAQEFDAVAGQLDNVIVGAHEVGIALGTAVVAAESYGLGTVPIGDVRLHALAVVEELDLPRYVIPLLGLCIGHPAENPSAKPRLPKEAVYFEERYDCDLRHLLDRYDSEYSSYLRKRPWNARVGSWTQMAADFYRPPYNHYPKIAEALRKQGFLADGRVCEGVGGLE